MLSAKANVLCLLAVLTRYSDENHIMTLESVQDKILADYGMALERKTVYANIKLLIDFGYDISVFRDNGIGYYLREREFEPSEVHLLADAVYASSFIPEKATSDLIKKLKNTQSVHFSGRIKSLTVIKPEAKTSNKELFYNTELLDDAISDGVKVTFDYLKYDMNKKLIPRREDKYTVSPYAIVWANEKYYLICYYEKYSDISHFRIDKIKNIELSAEPAHHMVKSFSPYEYAKSAIYMYGNKTERIELCCDNVILDDVIDKFGKDIRIEPLGGERFKACIHATSGGVKFWALQYLSHCEVVSPTALREEIKKIINNGADRYE